MKKYTIKNVTNIDIDAAQPYLPSDVTLEGMNDMEVSDGYHTMDELYEHRVVLFTVLCSVIKSANDIVEGTGGIPYSVWRSRKHSDGSGFDGWFILGIHKEKGKQITYHLPNSKWDEVSFAETLDLAPEWDGHTSKDVLERLKIL